MRQDLIRLFGRRVKQYAGESDQEQRDEEDLEGRIEHDRSADGCVVARGECLHEQVRPDGKTDDRNQHRRRVHPPTPGLAGGVQSRSQKQLGTFSRNAREHLLHASVQSIREIQAEAPGQQHHEDALERVGPSHAKHSATQHVDQDDAVDHGTADRHGDLTSGHGEQHVSGTLDLQGQVGNERSDADQGHEARDGAHAEPCGDHLGLGHETVHPAQARRTRTQEVERQETQRTVTEYVEGGRAFRVRAAGTAEKSEGAEYRRARDEIHHEQPQRAVTCHVARGCTARLSAGQDANDKAGHQVEQRDADDDGGRGHVRSLSE